MARIEIQLDPETLKRIQALARERGASVGDLLKAHLHCLEAGLPLSPSARSESAEDPLWGLFGDIPELLDEIVAETMKDREHRRLREADV